MDKLNCLSVNCRGLNTAEKRLKFYTWINDSNFDIIFIQETHYTENNIVNYDARWSGISVHCFSDSPFSRGVSILFRNNLSCKIINTHKTNDGRKLMVNIEFDHKIITIVNIYAPTM